MSQTETTETETNQHVQIGLILSKYPLTTSFARSIRWVNCPADFGNYLLAWYNNEAENIPTKERVNTKMLREQAERHYTANEHIYKNADISQLERRVTEDYIFRNFKQMLNQYIKEMIAGNINLSEIDPYHFGNFGYEWYVLQWQKCNDGSIMEPKAEYIKHYSHFLFLIYKEEEQRKEDALKIKIALEIVEGNKDAVIEIFGEFLVNENEYNFASFHRQYYIHKANMYGLSPELASYVSTAAKVYYKKMN